MEKKYVRLRGICVNLHQQFAGEEQLRNGVQTDTPHNT